MKIYVLSMLAILFTPLAVIAMQQKKLEFYLDGQLNITKYVNKNWKCNILPKNMLGMSILDVIELDSVTRKLIKSGFEDARTTGHTENIAYSVGNIRFMGKATYKAATTYNYFVEIVPNN